MHSKEEMQSTAVNPGFGAMPSGIAIGNQAAIGQISAGFQGLQGNTPASGINYIDNDQGIYATPPAVTGDAAQADDSTDFAAQMAAQIDGTAARGEDPSKTSSQSNKEGTNFRQADNINGHKHQKNQDDRHTQNVNKASISAATNIATEQLSAASVEIQTSAQNTVSSMAAVTTTEKQDVEYPSSGNEAAMPVKRLAAQGTGGTAGQEALQRSSQSKTQISSAIAEQVGSASSIGNDGENSARSMRKDVAKNPDESSEPWAGTTRSETDSTEGVPVGQEKTGAEGKVYGTVAGTSTRDVKLSGAVKGPGKTDVGSAESLKTAHGQAEKNAGDAPATPNAASAVAQSSGQAQGAATNPNHAVANMVMTDASSAGGAFMASGATHAGSHAHPDAFAALDAAAEQRAMAPHTIVTANDQQVEVSVDGMAHGVAGVRAELANGGVQATLIAASAATAHALRSSLPAMSLSLDADRVPLSGLAVLGPKDTPGMADSFGSGGGNHPNNGNDADGNNAGNSGSGNADARTNGVAGVSATGANEAITAQAANAASWNPTSSNVATWGIGGQISVVA